jgi:hypothetical protein
MTSGGEEKHWHMATQNNEIPCHNTTKSENMSRINAFGASGMISVTSCYNPLNVLPPINCKSHHNALDFDVFERAGSSHSTGRTRFSW